MPLSLTALTTIKQSMYVDDYHGTWTLRMVHVCCYAHSERSSDIVITCCKKMSSPQYRNDFSVSVIATVVKSHEKCAKLDVVPSSSSSSSMCD
jgi:hypothetical protein